MQEYEHLKVNLIIVISCECCNEKFVGKKQKIVNETFGVKSFWPVQWNVKI